MEYLAILTLLLQMAFGYVRPITCPYNRTEWQRRSSEFPCLRSEKTYHCIMTETFQLTEICVSSMLIPKNQGGCPSLYVFDSEGYWMFPHTHCPFSNKDCPEESHQPYYTDELYKYPACFLNISERMKNKDIQITTSTTEKIFLSSNTQHYEDSMSHEEEDGQKEIVAATLSFGAMAVTIIILFVLFHARKTCSKGCKGRDAETPMNCMKGHNNRTYQTFKTCGDTDPACFLNISERMKNKDTQITTSTTEKIFLSSNTQHYEESMSYEEEDDHKETVATLSIVRIAITIIALFVFFRTKKADSKRYKGRDAETPMNNMKGHT